MDGVIGEIRMFAGNFEPGNWAFCNGQLLPISQNTALFSILGTVYGGNGTSTFGLPNLNGKVSMGTGTNQGGSTRQLGQVGGATVNTLMVTNISPHTHTAQGTVTPGAISANGTLNVPTGNYPAKPSDNSAVYGAAPSNVQMGQSTVSVTVDPAGNGNPQAFSIVQPSVGMNFIICLRGIFPDRP
jgi:microcystin-dependent protein